MEETFKTKSQSGLLYVLQGHTLFITAIKNVSMTFHDEDEKL